MSFVNIENRRSEKLVDSTANLRISSFSTPSSFHVQLKKEDRVYESLQTQICDFYNVATFFSEKSKPFLKKLKISEIQKPMYITVKIEGKWLRMILEEDRSFCNDIDSGRAFKLSEDMERIGIYALEFQFLILPPRAILCGLGKIIPVSSKGHCWSEQACELFNSTIKGGELYAHFLKRGFLNNSYYIFLSCKNRSGYNVHINTLLCAYDLAIVDIIGLHHPIWRFDYAC